MTRGRRPATGRRRGWKSTRSLFVWTVAAVLLAGTGSGAVAACPRYSQKHVGTAWFDAARELSGISASRRNAGVLWTHNDSGDTERVFAISTRARYLGTYRVSSDHQDDWEDIAVGPGPARRVSYIYIGSIGGNSGRQVTYVYRAREPAVSASQAPATLSLRRVVKLRMRYPDGAAYNAETLLVNPRNHAIFVVTKSSSGITHVFRYPPAHQDPSRTYTLQRVRTLRLPGPATAGDISPDTSKILIKGYSYTYLWRRPRRWSIARALGAAPCRVATGPGEAIGFARRGGSYFTVAEGYDQPLYRFFRVP
jgi:hypothetical protein